MLADAPDTGQVVTDFRNWLGAAIPVTSYNVGFDRVMVERMGLTDLRWAHCLMLRSMELMGPAGVLRDANPSHPRYEPGRPWLWPSLAHAREFFNVAAQEPAHRALSDARVAARVAVEAQRLMLGGVA